MSDGRVLSDVENTVGDPKLGPKTAIRPFRPIRVAERRAVIRSRAAQIEACLVSSSVDSGGFAGKGFFVGICGPCIRKTELQSERAQ